MGGGKGIVTETPGIRLQSRDSTTFQGEGVCRKKVKDHHREGQAEEPPGEGGNGLRRTRPWKLKEGQVLKRSGAM